jgi:hypothetical protein
MQCHSVKENICFRWFHFSYISTVVLYYHEIHNYKIVSEPFWGGKKKQCNSFNLESVLTSISALSVKALQNS